MSAHSDRRTMPVVLVSPLAAVCASLTAVTGFILLLGLVFLPMEARRWHAEEHVSVTQVLVPQEGASSVALYWSIPKGGPPGWRHHLAVAGAPHTLVAEGSSRLEPMSITRISESTQIILGNWDGSLDILDTARPLEPLKRLGKQQDGGVIDVICSPDGRFALSQNAFQLYGWDLAAGRQIWRCDHQRAGWLAACATRGSAIVGDFEGGLHEISLATGERLRTVTHFTSPVVSMAMSGDDERLAILTADGRMQLLGGSELRLQWTLKAEWHCASGRFIAISPNGESIVTVDPANPWGMTLYAAADGRPTKRLQGHEGLVLGAAYASYDTLWSWGADGTIRTWNIATGEVTSVVRCTPLETPTS